MQQTSENQFQKDADSIKSWIDLTNVLIDLNPGQQQQVTKEMRAHLKNVGYLEPAPIQKMVLPYLLTEKTPEKFCYIKSPTGTGKTLAFILPQLFFFEDAYLNAFTSDLDGKPCYFPYALIIVNQHPLLRQIRDDFDAAISPELKAKGLIVQHFDKGDNENQIKGQILCGVPAKIKELVQKGFINLQQVRYIVVDEADNTIMADKNKMVMSTLKDVIKTGNMAWKMIVCGATIDMESLRNHFKEELGNLPPVQKIEKFFEFKFFNYEILLDNIQHYYQKTIYKDQMDALLIQIISEVLFEFDHAQIMVFFNEKVECQNISNKLKADPQLKYLVEKNQICEVRSIVSGEEYVPRSIQQEIIEQFRSEKKKLMLCSDLMGRGMNFRKVRLVVNYGVPRISSRGGIDMRKYDQRVGRTGRMEDLGVALTIFNPDCDGCDQEEITLIDQCKLRKIEITEYVPDIFATELKKVIEKTSK